MYWPTSRLVYYTHPKPLIYRGKPAELYGGNNHQTPCGKGQGEDWCWAACAVYFGTFAAHKTASVKRKV